MMNKYRIKIFNKGIFGSTTNIDVTDKEGEFNFIRCKNGCFEVWGNKDGKTVNYIFPLNRIDCISIKEL